MVAMRRAAPLLAFLLAVPMLAQKPWEQRTDLDVTVPVELPALPTINPFARPLLVQPAPVATPLAAKFNLVASARGTAYVNGQGGCQRVVFSSLPLPFVGEPLHEGFREAVFVPGRAAGGPAATWWPFALDLNGRVKEGTVVRVQPAPPPPGELPVPEAAAATEPAPTDAALPATPLDQLAQPPAAKRFRAHVDGRDWSQKVRLLAEVSPEGRCSRVVFLSCPEGLRRWLLASLASWTFRPGEDNAGPVSAWVQLDAELRIAIGSLESGMPRLSR
jgi:hypothetical protein